ncbi:MAG TPA: TOBE domain-containing protein [Caulobacteraceae bacterium]|nr:TOBE domain-containing protein [Caulobacteraceae bacterium]
MEPTLDQRIARVLELRDREKAAAEPGREHPDHRRRVAHDRVVAELPRLASKISGAVSAEVTLEISPGVEIVAAISRASVEALGLAVGSDALALIKASFVILAAGDAPLRTSARNCLRGKVVAIEHGAVNTEVILKLADGKTLAATITRQSAETLDLTMDAAMAALVKASHVILAVE